MIEQVDPNDTDKLDEIDARVAKYLNPDCEIGKDENGWFITEQKVITDYPTNFSRSRDALKAIRPSNWKTEINILNSVHLESEWSHCKIYRTKGNGRIDEEFFSPELKSEELAELHAIIQAIEYESEQGDE